MHTGRSMLSTRLCFGYGIQCAASHFLPYWAFGHTGVLGTEVGQIYIRYEGIARSQKLDI